MGWHRDMHRLQELVRLHREGLKSRDIARLLRMGRNSVRGYQQSFMAAGLLEGAPDDLPTLETLKAAAPSRPPIQEVSTVEEWVPTIRALLAKGVGPQAIFDRLRSTESTFQGSLGAIKRVSARLRKEVGVSPADVVIPVETDPGEVAQVDFGFAGLIIDPETHVPRKAWFFVMVLAYSRHMFAKIVFRQDAATWQQLHVEAFAALGGVPKVIVPDNLKAAVVRCAFGLDDDLAVNRGYIALARHYRFLIDPTPPRSPEKKGKVEAGVKYVANNFLATLPDGLDIDETNRQLVHWVDAVAGRRIHGSTHRQPLEVFESEERATLQPLPPRPYVPVVWKKARVHADSHVAFDKRLYSVPYKFIGQDAWIEATPFEVVVYVDDLRVGIHDRRGGRVRSTEDAHLPAERVGHRHRGRDFWIRRAAALGDEVGLLVGEIFSLADAVSPLRTVQGIVMLFEKHPRDRANNTARRARHFGIRTYKGIAEILRKALDFDPLPPDLPLALPPNPRFARDVAELLSTKKDPHDWN
jgi:transposase